MHKGIARLVEFVPSKHSEESTTGKSNRGNFGDSIFLISVYSIQSLVKSQRFYIFVLTGLIVMINLVLC